MNNSLYQKFVSSFVPHTFELQMELFFASIFRELVHEDCRVLEGHRELPKLFSSLKETGGDDAWNQLSAHGDSIVFVAGGWERKQYQDVAQMSVTVRTVSGDDGALARHEERAALVRSFFSEEQLGLWEGLDGIVTSGQLVQQASDASELVRIQGVERVGQSVRDFDGERLAWMFTESFSASGTLTEESVY